MNLKQQAQLDVKQITTNKATGFGEDILLTAPNGQTATVVGLHTKHHLGADTDGNRVNTKNAHISFAEAALLAVNPLYPVRNAGGEVALKDHLVVVKDSTGLDKNYIIKEWFPDETVDLIVCILGDYTP